MKIITFLLRGFGFDNIQDFNQSTFKLFYIERTEVFILISLWLGTIKAFIEFSTGLDIFVYCAFVFLIVAETQTGVRVSIRNKKRLKSRLFGRMLLKVSVYTSLLWVLNMFSTRLFSNELGGVEVNPFQWLYYMAVVWILFQFLISYLENLSGLGYHKLKGLIGIILRKFNQWFEFDGSKNPDKHEVSN